MANRTVRQRGKGKVPKKASAGTRESADRRWTKKLDMEQKMKVRELKARGLVEMK